MKFISSALFALATALSVSATDIWIQVGANTTANASLIFQPQEVHAGLNDTVFFNFTSGNYSAIQSTFASPCIPAHETNITINGFDSGFRPTNNGTATSILSVPILPANVNTTFWFYDFSTCGQGGVGVINANDSSTETLAGFVRNAIRLNGTATSSSSLPSSTVPTGTGVGGVASSSGSPSPSTSSGADRTLVVSGLSVLPLALLALAL